MNYQISLGQLRLGTPLTWEGNPNFHAYLSGNSGQGKTFLLRNMAGQVPELGGRCIIFDYSGDFVAESPQQDWPPPNTEVIDIRSRKVSLNPFLPQTEGETFDEIAERVVAIFSSGIRLGIAQWAYLFDAITNGLEHELLGSIADLVAYIEMDAEENDTAMRLLPKVKRLGKLLPNGGATVDWKLDTPGITIIDLSTIKDSTTLAILAEMLLWAICNLRMSGGPKDTNPLVLLLDECQRLRFKDGDTTIRILREGRKFGIWGWFSTQWIQDKNAAAALGQAGLRIYFRPEEDNIHKTALKLSRGDRSKVPAYEKQLANLKRGQFMFWKGSRLIISSPPV